MRLILPFPHAEPKDWPADRDQRTRLVEDGDETTLHVEYENAKFVRPVAPMKIEELRAYHQQKGQYIKP